MNLMKFIKVFIYIAVISAVVIFLASPYFNWSLLDCINYTVTIASFLCVIYERYAWKLFVRWTHLPVLPKILTGEFKYENKDAKEWIRKSGTIQIKQTLLCVKIITETNEMKSVSVSANIREENEGYILYYVYRTEPKNEFVDKNPSKLGAARVDLSYLPNFKGKYWTTNSKGDFHFKPLNP